MQVTFFYNAEPLEAHDAAPAAASAGPAHGRGCRVAMALAGSCRTVPRTEPRVAALRACRAASDRLRTRRCRPGPPRRHRGRRARGRRSAPTRAWSSDRDADGPREERVARATFVAGAAAGPDPGRFRVQVASLADRGRGEAGRGQGRARSRASRRGALESGDAHAPGARRRLRDAPAGARGGGPAPRRRACRAAGWWRRRRAGSRARRGCWRPATSTARPAVYPVARRGDADRRRRALPRPARGPAAADGTRDGRQRREPRGLPAGVVPNELSPAAFPQIEALKAQAVAARTYALRNRGQFAGEGLRHLRDARLPGLPRARSTEHAALRPGGRGDARASSRSYRGGLINALYTSTCGGHTENGVEHLRGRGHAVPHGRGLRRRSARPGPRSAPRRRRGRSGGRRGSTATRRCWSRWTSSIQACTPRRRLQGPATDERAARLDARGWSAPPPQGLRRRARRRRSTRRGTFFRHLVGSLCWDERAARLLAPEDATTCCRSRTAPSWRERRASAGRGRAHPGGRPLALPGQHAAPGRAPSRARQAVALLAPAAAKAGRARPGQRRLPRARPAGA